MSELQNIENIETLAVSGSVLGKILNLTDRRVRQLAEDGTFKKIKRGQYNLVENIHSYITYLKTNNEAKEIDNNSDLDLDDERAKLERVKRLQAELKLAAMKGEMHEAKDVERVMNDMLANFRSKLLSTPSKLAPLLVARDDMGEIQEVISKEIFEALEELSNYNAAAFYSEDYIDLTDDTEFDEDKENVEVQD